MPGWSLEGPNEPMKWLSNSARGVHARGPGPPHIACGKKGEGIQEHEKLAIPRKDRVSFLVVAAVSD